MIDISMGMQYSRTEEFIPIQPRISLSRKNKTMSHKWSGTGTGYPFIKEDPVKHVIPGVQTQEWNRNLELE